MLLFRHLDGGALFTPGQHQDAVAPDEVTSLPRFKHNRVVAASARLGLRLMTRRLEKVVFTATTGRSGTKALAMFLSSVRDCIALHEPYPIMCGPVQRAATYGNTALVDKVYWRIKSINIVRAAVGSRYYVEAN